MSLSVLIEYRDCRPHYFNGFCHQSTLRDFWRPTAEQLNLSVLQRLEVLHITERAEAQQLVDELKTVATLLRAAPHLGQSPQQASYILETLDRLLPVFEATLAEWQNIEAIIL